MHDLVTKEGDTEEFVVSWTHERLSSEKSRVYFNTKPMMILESKLGTLEDHIAIYDCVH